MRGKWLLAAGGLILVTVAAGALAWFKRAAPHNSAPPKRWLKSLPLPICGFPEKFRRNT
jgi:hypothetical protein